MAAAARAHPELVWSPRHPRRRFAQFHFGAAPLTTDVKADSFVAHAYWILAHPSVVRIYHRQVIPAIILAAGKSERMGRPKALLPLTTGDTFLTRIIATLREAGVDDIVVVLGHEPEVIVAVLDERDVSARVVINPDYEAGQLSSTIAGLDVIDRPGVVAALVAPVDMPLVAPATVRALLDRYRQTGAEVVRPARGSRHGHPMVIDRSLFDVLRNADPSVGPRLVIRAHASATGDVEVDDDGAFLDIDTPEEYEQLLSGLQQRAGLTTCSPPREEALRPDSSGRVP